MPAQLLQQCVEALLVDAVILRLVADAEDFQLLDDVALLHRVHDVLSVHDPPEYGMAPVQPRRSRRG